MKKRKKGKEEVTVINRKATPACNINVVENRLEQRKSFKYLGT